jgi:hypothetical protein
MSTWSSIFSDLRTDLSDTTVKPRWSNDLLLLFAKDAVRIYSINLPRLVYRQEISAQSGSFSLPAGTISIVSVETTEGVYLSRFEPKPGRKVRAPGVANAYFADGSKIYLNVAPSDGDKLLLTYRAYYSTPTSTTPPQQGQEPDSGIPPEDEELIRLYVKAKISEQMRLGQSSLDRFKPAGSRDDNPLLPEHNELMAEFHTRIAQRLGGVIQLNRRGRFL